jgi:hypothetical protein
MSWLSAGCGGGEGAMAANPTPVETRAQDSAFVAQCSLVGLQDRLPLLWPAPSDAPASPKNDYRSQYIYLGWEDLQDPVTWEHLSDFDLLLRLVDFTPLRPVLAQLLGWTSAQGQKPFDPISIFLLIGWRITNGWNRAETLRNLRDPRYADYAQRFGFVTGFFPTEGGLRHWLTTIGRNSTSDEVVLVDEKRPVYIAIQRLNHLIAQSVTLLLQAGLLSPAAWEHALICPDGLIHDAASRERCISAQDTCYQPTSSDSPRPCPAKEKQRQGCDCDTTACASVCRHATLRDPDARFIWYSGSNQPQHSPNCSVHPSQSTKKRGKGRFGYRSLPIQLAAAARRFSVVLLDDFLPANAREETPTAALLLQLATFYPDLHVDTVAGDAAFGYDRVLDLVYHHLHARRAIDLRADRADKDKPFWSQRGYDDKGRPICPYGYAFTANGFDKDRHRYKWFCGQACRNGTSPAVCVTGAVYPPADCPHANPDRRPFGDIINVYDRFNDGSIRLVRDIPVGTPAWKRIYHRARNAVEGRNATFQRWHLKRLPVYGTPRSKALIFQADVWLNLTTLARLVREATAATGCT